MKSLLTDRLSEYYRPVQRRRFPLLDRLRPDNPRLNVILFLSTCASTFLTGWMQSGWTGGLWYSFGIISILYAHEMGHYLMCRRYGIRATLPFFIPLPLLSPFGTLGAVIKIESLIPSRKALFDVAVAGPLAGLALTIPAIYFGVQLSQVVETSAVDLSGTISLGESFLFSKISTLARGTLSDNQDLILHPLAYAGWAGLFVTSLNLLPIGQLDGGHVTYALLGRKHNLIATAALVAFALIAIFVYHGWALLLLFLLWFGHKHPPTLDETPIDNRRKALAIFTLLIFVLSFTPTPFLQIN